MPPRFFVDQALQAGDTFSLPAGPARHVQVLRLQPGAALRLFDGRGGEWAATIERIGRSEVTARLGMQHVIDRELPLPFTLALGMPANERMDTLIEKATELGASTIQPLVCERSVLRLSGDRAAKKVAHWQAVAIAACEQCGRTRVPQIAPVRALPDWLAQLPTSDASRWVLSLAQAKRPTELEPPRAGVVCLSGPEGGLSPSEEAAARAAGFVPVSLGPRVLRADTAPLALLAHLAVLNAHATNE